VTPQLRLLECGRFYLRVALVLAVVNACATPLACSSQARPRGSAAADGGVERPDAPESDGASGQVEAGEDAGLGGGIKDAATEADDAGAAGGGSSAPDASGERDGAPTAIPVSYPTSSGSASVALGDAGTLDYTPDLNGDTVPDFSTAGYMGGGIPLPLAPVITALPLEAGESDASGRIQTAIDALSKAPIQRGDGLRGAILFEAGVYPISTSITIRASGIVLRGAGDGATGTILRIVSGGTTPAVVVQGEGAVSEVAGTRQNLTDSYVPVGAKWFRVASASGFSVGDDLVVYRPSTAAWIDAISMTWAAGSADMAMERKILAIEDNRILVDGPVTVAIDQKYGGGYVYKYTSNRIQNVGIEQIRGESSVRDGDAGDGNGQFIVFNNVENGWVSHCTNNQIAGVIGESSTFSADHSKWITVEDVTSAHNLPKVTTGPKVLDFTFKHSQMILFHRLVASNGGHEFTSQEENSGPNVYLESQTPAAYGYTGPHYMWSAATLYDSLKVNELWLLQLGDNWGGGNIVVWNSSATDTAICDRPATAHQWMFGVTSPQTTSTAPRAGDLGASQCEWHSFGTPMSPASLYRQQLSERLGPAALAALGSP
jgi:hypothetical protein